jgi:hypothetical protein
MSSSRDRHDIRFRTWIWSSWPTPLLELTSVRHKKQAELDYFSVKRAPDPRDEGIARLGTVLRFVCGASSQAQLTLPSSSATIVSTASHDPSRSNSRVFFRVDHLHRTSNRRIVGANSRLMFCQTGVEVVGLANVVRPVGASQDVHERHRTTMPSSDSIWNRRIVLVGALRLTRVAPRPRRPFAQDYHSTDASGPP